MANKPGEANFFPDVPEFPSMGTFQPVYGKFDLTTYIQGASDYEIMAFLVGKYNACLEAYGNITKLSTDTITACKQLQDWINSWFTNLDVQEEINKKLDKMVADGSFGTLLHQTFDAQINQQTTSAVTAWLVANVTPTGSAVVVDKSLSIEGAAADAKTTGEKLNSLYQGLNSLLYQLDERKITGYLIYPQTKGFYEDSNGAVGRYEIEKDVEYIFNFDGSYLLSNNSIIEQNKEVYATGKGFVNTEGYRYLFINSVKSDGTSYNHTVSASKSTGVLVNNNLVHTISFDSDPQTQFDDINTNINALNYGMFNVLSIKTLASNFAIVADSTSQYYGDNVRLPGYSVTDFLDISKYKEINITVWESKSSSTIGLVFYNLSKEPIEGHFYANGSDTNVLKMLTIPAGAVYVRTTYKTDEHTYGYLQCYGIGDNLTHRILTNEFTGKKIFVAASDTSIANKAIADFVCDGANDEVEIQNAINLISEFSEGKVILSDGNFYIDNFYFINNKYIAISVQRGSPERKHIIGAGRFRHSKTVINVTAKALSILGENKGSVFGTHDFVYGRSAVYENFSVYLADNQHKVTVIDNTGLSSGMCNDLTISAVPESISNTYDTPMPNKDCIGVTGYCGDDAGTYNEMNRVFVTGFYEGFRLGGEHLVCKNLGARYNYYSYTFGNYYWHIGTQSHPITLINCCDEHAACLPKFVRSGNYDETDQHAKQEINFIDFNLELARSENFGGGYTEPAKEVNKGAFCGKIEFTGYGGSNVSGYPNPSPSTTNNPNIKFWADGSGEYFTTRNMVHPIKGTTAQRNFIATYMQQYFDTTLNKMLIYDGTKWIDMNGNAVN